MRISDLLPEVISWAETQPEIVALYLYGSQAEGYANALSDVDIAVLVENDLARELVWQMEDRWAAKWLDTLDLRVMNLAPLEFRFDILTRGERIWERDLEQVAEIESLTRRKYWDIKPLLERDWAAFVKEIAEKRSEIERVEYQKTLDEIRAVHRRVREASKSHSDTIS